MFEIIHWELRQLSTVTSGIYVQVYSYILIRILIYALCNLAADFKLQTGQIYFIS